MTNQPDAYTLAAKAAADRARAEALQRGARATGPSLQNPMRRLSKVPAVRWLLSAVLLGAGTALAVDYLNTPLRAWLQYHAPVPGAPGKSVAQIAAEQSAAPQAKINNEINAPAEAEARTNASEASDRANDQKRTKLSPVPRIANIRVLYHPVESGFGNLFGDGIAVWPDWHEMHDIAGIDYTGFPSTPAAPMPAGTFTPFVLTDGRTIAAETELDANGQPKAVWIIGKFVDGHYGAVLKSDFARLAAVRPPSSGQPPEATASEDHGAEADYYLPDKDPPAIKSGGYLFSTDRHVTMLEWKSCSPTSGGAVFVCTYANHAGNETFRFGERVRVHTASLN